jgi:hypothetical protein
MQRKALKTLDSRMTMVRFDRRLSAAKWGPEGQNRGKTGAKAPKNVREAAPNADTRAGRIRQ